METKLIRRESLQKKDPVSGEMLKNVKDRVMTNDKIVTARSIRAARHASFKTKDIRNVISSNELLIRKGNKLFNTGGGRLLYKYRHGNNSPIKLNPDGSPMLSTTLRATEKSLNDPKKFAIGEIKRNSKPTLEVEPLPKYAVKHPKPFNLALKRKIPSPHYSASIFGVEPYQMPYMRNEPGTKGHTASAMNLRIPMRNRNNKMIKSMINFDLL